MLQYRVAILGCPVTPNIPWTLDNLKKCSDLGFNVMQLNIAWGARPADEPLNLEDVVALSPADTEHYPQVVPLRSKAERFGQRRTELRRRIELCRQSGLRSIFHFGAPYNAHQRYGDNPPNCLCDERTLVRHEFMIDQLAIDFGGIDDLLLYTYDQDAWLCSEFGTCPRCKGVPLHQRVSAFVNRLARRWHRHNPNGRFWWEPWELSAGQTLASLPLLDASCVGLMLHDNAAECMVTLPVDRFVRNAVRMATEYGIPAIIEGFLGAPTEEVEPYTHLQTPLTTFHQVRAITFIPNVSGIKEYFGIVPTKEDPNLRASSLALHHSQLTDDEMLKILATPYGNDNIDDITCYWRLASEAMELFPWETSWYIRKIGLCNPHHAMTAAFIRGQQAHTPSWESTRRSIFIKTDNQECDPWLLEDIQLQCALAADKMEAALNIGRHISNRIPDALQKDFAAGLDELDGFRRRALSYVYHLRETNLTKILRDTRNQNLPFPTNVLHELEDVLQQDQANMQTESILAPALQLLRHDPQSFVQQYFLVPETNGNPLGGNSCTSR